MNKKKGEKQETKWPKLENKIMKKSYFLFALILSACGPMRITPKQNYTRTETATFWGLFTACQGAEAMDAAQTYHGIANHQGIEGRPYR